MNHRLDPRVAALTLIAVGIACLPLILIGPQTGDSLYTNLSWASQFTEELFAGQWYPRWLAGLNAGAGSPVFFFYAPLPFYVTAAASMVCRPCGAVIQLGLAEALIVLASAAAFLVFARRFAGGRAAAVATLIYALAPYHFAMDVLRRQAIGEAAAYIGMPLALYFCDRLARGDGPRPRMVVGLAVSYALLVLSHLPATLLFSPFMLAWLLFAARRHQVAGALARVALAVMLGVALSAIYLLPALFEQGSITMSALYSAYYEYHRWFFFDGADSPNESLSRMLLLVFGCPTLALLVLAALLRRRLEADERRVLQATLFLVVGAWWLMTPLSYPVWWVLPLLQKVQFPWRVGIVIDLAMAIALAVAFEHLLRMRGPRRLLGLSVALAPLLLSLAMSAWYFAGALRLKSDPAHQAMIRQWIVSGEDTDEYMPSGIDRKRAELTATIAGRPLLQWNTEHGAVIASVWQGRRVVLETRLDQPAAITVRQFRFDGWHARVVGSGAELPVGRDHDGLIVLRVPAGLNEVELTLPPLPSERIGWAVSLCATLACLALWLRGRRQRGGRRRSAPVRDVPDTTITAPQG